MTQTTQNIKFDGVYTNGATTNDDNTASDSLLALSITPGKAVKVLRLKRLQTFKDINKARDFQNVNVGFTTYEIGNFAKITNLYNTPDIGAVSGETTAYKTFRII